MQQELQLKSNCKQKDLFRNSNWKKFTNNFYQRALLHRPFCDFFPLVRLWRDRKRPAKTSQDIFISCFATSYS